MKQDATILVCCHKDDYYYDGENYLPIQVGKELSNVDLGIQGDNNGDNISSKNPNYCELTAHYWYWKNCEHSKYVGLNHYRRYFDFNNSYDYRHSRTVSKEQIIVSPPILPNLDEIFKSYDIILAKPIVYPYSLEHDYAYCHIVNDLRILRNVINEFSPEYNEAYNQIMIRNNKLSHYNMFISSSEIFNEYSEWCFKILFEVENRVKISAYYDQARIFGYMSERMLNIYVARHNLRVKYLPIIKVEDRPYTMSLCGHIVRNIRNQMVFRMFRK